MYLRSRQPLTAEQISQIFGTLCNDLLGVYEYSDGSIRKAVRISKGNKTTKTYGIECVVSAAPDIIGRDEYWTIFFIDSSNCDYQRMRAITQILQNNFVKIKTIRMVPSSQELDNDDQMVLTLDRGQLEAIREKLRIS